MANEILVESIISRSDLPEIDFEINPYQGCIYQCIYCYARHSQNFLEKRQWGEYVDIKINAPDLISDNTSQYRGKEVFIGSVTDPYLPEEQTHLITRRILQKLIKLEPNLSLQTKSDLVIRDIDLLQQFKNCEIGVTLTTLDDSLRKEIEPAAPEVEKRTAALKALKKAGLDTYIYIGPLMPLLTDWKAIINETREFCDSYYFEILNIEGSIWNSVKNWLIKYHPNLLNDYENFYFSDNKILRFINHIYRSFSSETLFRSGYFVELHNEIKEYCESNKIDYTIMDHKY